MLFKKNWVGASSNDFYVLICITSNIDANNFSNGILAKVAPMVWLGAGIP
ncbi:MAG: hypothetical protein QM498_00695 [Desulfobacterium sp.]